MQANVLPMKNRTALVNSSSGGWVLRMHCSCPTHSKWRCDDRRAQDSGVRVMEREQHGKVVERGKVSDGTMAIMSTALEEGVLRLICLHASQCCKHLHTKIFYDELRNA